ncbi:MAG: tRNA (adenosine(37)-N6)-threonylcarbamoyltransferase complex transferase subunit TsaD [Chloroflexi bacterium]|nr:tRNA (adenosine(37)-N6)-threonylcarbamoyltransferase complex transferase subunit TsaD [Chloroflexota bacterium]MBV9895852.1 tRNA (adenosine(37)-N6)-threonylcarbamoyltransferase complex transferase subunit TsaD [Chloroflexota bacterium]
MTRILGIETSCDETAVAIVRDGCDIESNVIASQIDLHARYGGVMPEQASRAHLRAILPTLEEALASAHADWSSLDAVAVTHGPGLAGALLVGVNVAKGLAFAQKKPLLGINHLEGHVYANWLDAVEAPDFPLVGLIVSGGHTDLVLADAHGRYRRLGRTRDDAAGEAFDKVARMLGLGFPGGPLIERAAQDGDPLRFRFPRAWLEPDTWDVSFSGLKTAVLHGVRDLGIDTDHATPQERLAKLPVADLAASFQAAVVDVLATRAVRAARVFGASRLVLGGGVAANRTLLKTISERADVQVLCPPPALCTDNAAMIAAAAYFRFRAGERSTLALDVEPNLPIA